MIRLTILSGKGGTGKTSITAAFGHLAGESAVLCDCDVDAANLSLVCGDKPLRSEDYSGGAAALIDRERCSSCGKCMQVCRFGAVEIRDGYYSIYETACEGCGYCQAVCPAGAIALEPVKSGEVFLSESRFGSHLVYAELNTGAENSGKLSTRVRNLADETASASQKNFVIIDGPPGISCPAIAAVSGADYVLFVAEPTLAGFSDLKRVMELAAKLRISSGVIVNKSDINSDLAEEIELFAKNNNTDFLGKIPYSEYFISAVRQGKAVSEITDDASVTGFIKSVWAQLVRKLEEKDENRIQRSGK